MRGKLVTNHKDQCFHFPHFTSQITKKKQKNKKTKLINYQTKNNTTQPSNRNIHVKIRKLTQKKKFGERTQRGGRWLGKPRKFHSHGFTVSGDRSEREGCWLGFNGEVDVETHGGGAIE